jgi:hypothetical protein
LVAPPNKFCWVSRQTIRGVFVSERGCWKNWVAREPGSVVCLATGSKSMVKLWMHLFFLLPLWLWRAVGGMGGSTRHSCRPTHAQPMSWHRCVECGMHVLVPAACMYRCRIINVCIIMHVSMHASMHVYACARACVHMFLRGGMHVCKCACMHACMHVCIHTCMCGYMYSCVSTHQSSF